MLKGIRDKLLEGLSSAKDSFVEGLHVDRDAKIANIEEYHQMLQVAQFAPHLNRWFLRAERTARVFGVDFPNARKFVDELNELAPKIETLANFPDEFNSVFASQGWILYGGLNHEVAEQALLASKDSLTKADAILTEYYDKETLEFQFIRLAWRPEFRPRMELAKLAMNDYLEGRYYSSVPLVLMLMDGVANEIGNDGFFGKDADLTAWNSATAHPKGLVALQKAFTRPRKKTRVEELTLPMRHGILHGRDLGYANKTVAAKCWAALFAIGDLVVKNASGEKTQPEPVEEKGLLTKLMEHQDFKKRADDWRPRSLQVGVDYPPNGSPESYPTMSPEQAFVEFANHWKARHYEQMLDTLFDDSEEKLKRRVGELARSLQCFQLMSYKVLDINDDTAHETKLKVEIEMKNTLTPVVVRMDIVTKSNEFAIWGTPDATWKLRNWHQLLAKLDC